MNIYFIFLATIGIFDQLNVSVATEIPNVPAASDAVQSNATNLPDTPAEPPKPDATPTDANSKDFNAAEFVAQLDPDEIFETKLPDINAELIELVIKLHSILILYLNANAVTETEEKLIRDEFKQFLTEFVGKFVEEKLDEIENQTPEEIAKFEDTFLINTLPCNVFDIIEDLIGIFAELKKIYLPLSAHFVCTKLP